ncbi:MAG: ShlB/FhaC/HecB family hemolysin secretion/activation protein [Thiobacillaceae bacterium]
MSPIATARAMRIAAFAALLALAVGAAAQDRFDVLEYVVEGNSVLPALRIEEAVYPHLGEGRSIQDVEAARTALERAYHDSGYLTVFVDIPEQEVKAGVVRLKVTEGRVERLRVTGSRYYSLGRIKAGVPDLAEGSVPYFPEVQQQLAALAAADRRVTPVLRPGRTPGKVEAELQVQDRLPLHGSVEVNDRHSANTSRLRLSANLRYDNLWQSAHSLALGVQTSPADVSESAVFSATYVAPLGRGDYLAAYAVHSESDVAAVGDVNVVGKGDILGLRWIRPLRARPGYSHSLTLGMDYKDFRENVVLQGADQVNTPIAYLPFSLAYEGTLQAAAGQTRLGATLGFAVRGLLDDEVECLPGVLMNEFACKRYLASPNYAWLRLDLRDTHRFAASWSLASRLSAQLASGPLISNEQFTAGGADSVRGYKESNSSGDDGWLAGLELRTPSLAAQVSETLTDLSLHAFVEGASLRVREALPGQQSRFDLLSAGLGLRFAGKAGYRGSLDLAHAFRDAGQVQAGDGRLHFALGYEW